MPAEERTESATPKRREEVRKKGQVARSTELGSALVLLASFVALKVGGGYIYDGIASLTIRSFADAPSVEFTTSGVYRYFLRLSVSLGLIMAPILLSVMMVGVVSSATQVGLVLSPQALTPSLAKLNPISGLSRLFSARSMVELVKSLLKVAIVGYVGYSTVNSEFRDLFRMADMDLSSMLAYTGQLTYSIGLKTGVVLLILGIADYIYQRVEFEKSIRMTKQEIKEEAKESDGDPLIRSRIRAKQREMSMRRMMQAVPKADVVITNPTHYAVAISYDDGEMDAPTVVAKGQDHMAQRIKDVAKEHGVPLVENKPLARALYQAVDVGRQIPPDLYRAVAEVLAFVYKLRGKTRKRA